MWSFYLTIVLIISTLNSISTQDDFGYEHIKHHPIQRLWGIPDTTAQIGHLFYYQIPKSAFDGNVARYKAFSEKEGSLPSWLIFYEKSGVLEGVPTEEDLGEHYITIKAFDEDFHDSVKDIFALEVLSKTSSHFYYHKTSCNQLEEKTILALVLDVSYSNIKPKERVLIIKNIAGFLNLDIESIQLSRLSEKNEILGDYVIDAGPGNVKKKTAHSSTLVQWQIGCSKKVWSKYKTLLDTVKAAARDGTLTEVIQHPVIGWKLVREESDFRKRREIHNKLSNDKTEEILDDIPSRMVLAIAETPVFSIQASPSEKDSIPVTPLFQRKYFNEENFDDIPSRMVVAITETPLFHLDPSPFLALHTSSSSHRHRHHRRRNAETSSLLPTLSISATPTYIPERPVSLPSLQIDEIGNNEISPTATLALPTPFSTLETEEESINTESEPWTSEFFVSEKPTPPLPDISPTLEEEEEVPLEPANKPPSIVQRLEKKYITAGKSLRYKIPENVFEDEEDGDTRKLKVQLFTLSGESLTEDSWIQFDEQTQELYALPLEEHISKWVYFLNATDSGNLTVGDKIEVTVQNHKGKRTVNHAISAELLSVPPGISIKWQLRLLEEISNVIGDIDTNYITVLEIAKDPIKFIWTNDSLSRNDCPEEDIDNIFKILTGENGLKGEIFDGLNVGKITWEGRGQCKPESPELPPEAFNFPPVRRNQVDSLNATVGQLLIFTVPDDTFYDPEDGNTRTLKLTLVTTERNPISSSHWLQFDSKNQEFYGIPMPANVGLHEYQLICEDKGGKTTSDGLVVNVHPAPKVMYNVEFSMKLAFDYDLFVNKPPMHRNFVQKLAAVFRDSNTNSIVLSGFAPGSTIITWHNRSLPTNMCPDNEILSLRKILLGDDEKVTPHVTQLMGPDFQILSARLTPTGLCQGALTEISTSGGEAIPNDVTAISHGEQYIIGLLIPAVVITVMLLCAGLVACILYRRRRTGKMSVGDEDERQTFRSKGIPVIFQDELDERPEPTNKSPVIMKEEKPPLPPPEYQRGPPLATTALLSDTEDSPYQPPPPFTTSRDSSRPKPTPTYRMPPPYVPP